MNVLLPVRLQAYLEELMNRAHVIRLNLTAEQALYFRKACGVARHCYNWALAQWKQARAEGRRVNTADLKRAYNRIKREQYRLYTRSDQMRGRAGM